MALMFYLLPSNIRRYLVNHGPDIIKDCTALSSERRVFRLCADGYLACDHIFNPAG